MIALPIPMPNACSECPLCQHYPFSGETRCRGRYRADNVLVIDWNDPPAKRPTWCPLIDLEPYMDDLK